MTAPEAVVAAVQEALGCRRHSSRPFCLEHPWVKGGWSERGCSVALRAADAAWAAAYPAALRDAADRLEGYSHQDGKNILARAAARGTASTLRRWADQAEFLDHANNPERTRERATDEIERERWNDNSNAR